MSTYMRIDGHIDILLYLHVYYRRGFHNFTKNKLVKIIVYKYHI